MRLSSLPHSDQREAPMTHVNLDTQPEVVRQFVLALARSSDGTLLELGGRPVACLVPPPRADSRDWPPGYFDLAGSIDDETFVRPPQGELPPPVAVE